MNSLRWLVKPIGLLILLTLLTLWLHVSVVYLGHTQSIFCFCLPLHWDAAVIVWAFAPLTFAGIYYLTRNYRLSRFWQYVHVIGCFMLLVIYYCWSPLNTDIHNEFYSFNDPALKLKCESCADLYMDLLPIVTGVMLLIFCVGQIAFAGNLTFGILRGKKANYE